MASVIKACILVALACLGCGTGATFRDQPVAWQVDDARDISEPKERDYSAKAYFTNIFAVRLLDRLLELRSKEPAWNTNSLDEVPDSTWFQNRIGARRITPAEAARGTDTGGPPIPPLRIVRSKSGGGNPGFIAEDSTERTFIIKFDTLANPELQTAAGALVNRIFWTLGYNVPSDHVFEFRREQLSIAPGATSVDDRKRKLPLGWATIDAILKTSPRKPDGSFRALASEYLEGKPKGGFSPEGVRADDPNDRVPHEHRRELRGLRVFAAWVNHTDMKEDNTLDMYVEENGKRFLRHYLLDFGEALGGHSAEKGRPEDGFEYFIDWEQQFKATFALGLWKRPWEDLPHAPWASVGPFSTHNFEPSSWREAYPYWPFFEMDAADAYWAAKLVLRFDRPLLTAIVAEAHFSQPDAAEYMVATLLARRDAVARTYLDAVTPLDEFAIEGSELCMTDLAVRHAIAPSGMVEHLAGSSVVHQAPTDARGRVCLPLPPSDTYTIYRLRVRRGEQRRPAMELHLKGGPHARVLGLVRVVR